MERKLTDTLVVAAAVVCAHEYCLSLTRPLDAIHRMLGTVMVCGFLETFLSLMPVKWIQKVFPPLVSSITVILIGVALTGTGMKYWGGGVVCADMIWKQHCKFLSQVAPCWRSPPPYRLL